MRDLENQEMSVLDFLKQIDEMPHPLRIYLKTKDMGLQQLEIDELNDYIDFKGRFEIYEDEDGCWDNQVIRRQELQFIVGEDL